MKSLHTCCKGLMLQSSTSASDSDSTVALQSCNFPKKIKFLYWLLSSSDGPRGCRTTCECSAPGKGSAALSCGQNSIPRGWCCPEEGSSISQEQGASCLCWIPNSQLITRNWSILTWWDRGYSSPYLILTSHSSTSTATLPQSRKLQQPHTG